MYLRTFISFLQPGRKNVDRIEDATEQAGRRIQQEIQRVPLFEDHDEAGRNDAQRTERQDREQLHQQRAREIGPAQIQVEKQITDEEETDHAQRGICEIPEAG